MSSVLSASFHLAYQMQLPQKQVHPLCLMMDALMDRHQVPAWSRFGGGENFEGHNSLLMLPGWVGACSGWLMSHVRACSAGCLPLRTWATHAMASPASGASGLWLLQRLPEGRLMQGQVMNLDSV